MWVARRFVSSVAQRGKHGLFLRPQGSLPELELRYLQCTCCWRSRIPVAGFETLNATLSSSIPCEDDKSLDACYSPEQRAVILQLLNSATETELAGVKLLRGRKCHNIVEYRTRNGPFQNLESVINVPLLKHKSALIVFDSILNPQKSQKKKVKIQLAKFIRPEVDKSWLVKANSIVSIVCGMNKIAWAHLDKDMSVLHWRQEACHNFMTGTYYASSYLDDISAVVSQLPPADFYVVEKSSITMQNTNLFPIMAHMRTVEAMLFALLEPKAPHQDLATPPKVLNMMRVAVGRHFGLMLRESRTSGSQLVQQMMSESSVQKSPRVKFPTHLLVKYRDAFQMGNTREEMSDALLQAVAFYELLNEPS
ncbi:transcription elongation factor, mitochondrial [Osmerus eperlanus]|uniref:transcription elongation factor, mitochondrial n=1 Tax=Osmerus eperlanus TaxID=29151 RepID=UPI002E16137F